MPDLTGSSLGPYRILESIGRGGMATVYKAYQPGTERLVALKVLRDHIAQDSLVVKRFQQEARVIARLEHPNIVPVYDSGEQNGTLFLVMRYIRAGTVQDIIERGPLSARDASSLLTEIASALDYAHSMQIIHRDIKPNNILVDTQGHAYLTDFGVAKVLGDAGDLTATSVTLGTPAYMAPEQVMARPVTPQTDIYALGVTLYEMLTGRPPFTSDSPMAVAMMHLRDPLPPPREVNPAISDAAELVIMRAMAKDPQDRFQTAGEMAAALAEAVNLEAQFPGAPSVVVSSGGSLSREVTTVRLYDLAAVAAEIALTKGSEELTPGIREELRRQDRAAGRRRMLVFAPWIAGALVVIGLAATLILALNSNLGGGTSAGQTATAVKLLLDQLSSAQTQIAGGGSGLEPTLQYLQTSLAGAPATDVATQSTPQRNTPVVFSTTTAKPNSSAPTATPQRVLPRPVKTVIPKHPTLPFKLP